MTVVATGNKARTMDFQEGDVGYVQKSLLHYVENTGDTDLVFLEMFKSRSLSGLFFLGVAGAHAAGIGHGAFRYRQSDSRCNTKRGAGNNADMTNPCARIIVG
jgi:hypothetical protein